MLPNPDRQRRRYPRSVAGAGAVLIAALAALLIPLAASAQEPRVMAFEQPASGTITLQPGVNEVGWLAESADPQALFDEIPQLETIWTWHTLDQRWQAAARNVPSNLWTLYRLVPGMGLRLQITGDEPVNWQRSLVPASGKVELQPGNNFVAWAGRDGWDINQLAKGIGRQLQEIYSHNPDTGEHDAIWPVAEGAEPATVARGAALWIKMPRTIVWLQPTDILPRLVFPGNAPENVQAAATRDLRNTLNYFATEYGIQAEPAELEIWMPLELEALKQQLRNEGEEVDDIALDDLWSRAGGWAGSQLVVKRYENENRATSVDEISYQRTMTHEYFHRLQSALRNGGNYDAEWLVEGSASYAELDQQVASDDRTWREIESDLHRYIYDDAPRLISAEEENGIWQYSLGEIALRRLVKQSQPDAWVDFYRELSPTKTGPRNRWDSALPWRGIFASVFGTPLDEFYAEFGDWQIATVARNGPRPTDSNADQPIYISGRLASSDGVPLSGRFLSLNQIESNVAGERIFVGWQQRAETDSQGRYHVRVPESGQYILSVAPFDRNCELYYLNGSLTADRKATSLLIVSKQNLQSVNIAVPRGVCEHTISGRLLDSAGQPLVGIEVEECTNICKRSGFTDGAGRFRFSAPIPGIYKVRVWLANECKLYVRDRSIIRLRDSVGFHVPGGEMLGDVHIPAGTCERSINGRLLDSDGQPLGDVQIDAGGNYGWVRDNTDNDGTFSITVPREGEYELAIFLSDDCLVYFARGRVTANWNTTHLMRVAGEDVRVDVRIPAGICN